MGPTASTVVALGSLSLAALTVLVSYLNIRRQAELAMETERVKWLRERRDDVYGQIISVIVRGQWHPIPDATSELWLRLDEIEGLALRYASDAVLAPLQTISSYYESRKDEPERAEILTAEIARAIATLVRQIREELAGREEADKTLRRYDSQLASLGLEPDGRAPHRHGLATLPHWWRRVRLTDRKPRPDRS